MDDNNLVARYNYDSFTHDKFGPWMRWDQSPPKPAEEFRKAFG